MSQRFAAYAAAFEKAYATDDWTPIESLFAPQAVNEVDLGPPLGGRFEGRDAILAYFVRALDGFDRRFASREVQLLEGPRESADSVWIRGRAIYHGDGVPELVFDLEETTTFAGDAIVRLADHYDAANRTVIEDYVAAHGKTLGLKVD
jgi:hypothetical protein